MKYLLILISFYTFVFGQINPLINPKINNSHIIDIGTKGKIPNPGAEYVVIDLSIPALIRDTDNYIRLINRRVDTDICTTDEYGHISCNMDQATCEAKPIYKDDISSKHSASVTTKILSKLGTETYLEHYTIYWFQACYQGMCFDWDYLTDQDRYNAEVLLWYGGGYTGVKGHWETSSTRTKTRTTTIYECPVGYYQVGATLSKPIKVHAWGFDDIVNRGGSVYLNNVSYGGGGRSITLTTLDINGKLIYNKQFDTYGDNNAKASLYTALKNINLNGIHYYFITTGDSLGFVGLDVIDIVKSKFKGTNKFTNIGYRESYLLAGTVENGIPENIIEKTAPRSTYGGITIDNYINIKSVNGAYCKKDYNYYTYTCPNTVDIYGQTVIGPLESTGGDCQGIGIKESKGGVCPNQPVNGFIKNCLNYEQHCPFGDNFECIATAADNSTINDNIIGNKVYSLATSTKFTSVSMEALNCPKTTEDIKKCAKDWNLKNDNCTKPAINYLDHEDNDHSMFIDNKYFYNEKYASEVLKDNDNKYYYFTSAVSGFDFDKNICIDNMVEKCANPNYIFDKTKNECISRVSCEKEVNGVCYNQPVIKCDTGFLYDNDLKKCVRDKKCELGEYHVSSDSEGNLIESCTLDPSCKTSGFEYDKDIKGFCSTDLKWDNAYCNQDIATDNVCFETVNYNSWATSNLISDHNDMDWNVITDQGGPAMYQGVNTTGTYLYPDQIEDFVLQGKVRVGTGCGGGDDDTIGFVFGYKDSRNFWAVGWSRNKNYGGTSLGGGANVGLVLVKYINGKRYALNSLADSYGWSCTTKYTDFKVINSKSGVQVYKNGSLVINYKGSGAPKGKAGYFMVSQGEGYYKDFTILKTPTCKDSTYTYDKNSNICYQELTGGTYNYDFINKIVIESPYCLSGIYNVNDNTCDFLPTCDLGGIEVESDSGLDICTKDLNHTCLSDTSEYIYNNETKDLFKYDDIGVGACEVKEPCPVGETYSIDSNVGYCHSTRFVSSCADGYSLSNIYGKNLCISLPSCKDGWVKEGSQCKLNYNWFEYSCDSGWDGPNEIFTNGDYKSGGDCHAQCGFNNCNCNSEISPANSCSKEISINKDIHYLIEKKPLMYHNVSGEDLSPGEMNIVRGSTCSDNPEKCLESINKITGSGSNLCFYKKNGENTCFTVDGCYFNGEIKPLDIFPEDTIRNIVAIDPYTLTSNIGEKYTVPKVRIYTDKVVKIVNEVFKLQKLLFRFSSHSLYMYTSWLDKNIDFSCKERTTLESHYSKELPGLKLTTTDGIYNIDIISNYGWGNNDVFTYSNVTKKTTTMVCPDNYKEEDNKCVMFICPDNSHEDENGDCVKESCPEGSIFSYASNECKQVISSSCKINGHVGWSGRPNPIVSVGNSQEIGENITFEVSGSADFKDGTKWDNFNAATMAIQFSDGNWYTIANVTDTRGNEVSRSLPANIRLLSNKNYLIQNTDNNSCLYKNHNLDGMCGSLISILSPGTKLHMTAITDIESLNGLYNGLNISAVKDNSINLSFKFGVNTINVSKFGSWSPELKIDESWSTNVIDNDFSTVNDRLRFWDSYIDGYIGFLEFVREVKVEDRKEGYKPEFFDYEELMGDGFSSIALLSEKDAYLSANDKLGFNRTYAVRTILTSPSECSIYANKYNASVVNPDNFNTIDNSNIYKSIGIKDPYACVISLEGIKIPSNSRYAVKTSSFSGDVSYKCSPWTCDDDNTCGKAYCDEDYSASVLPAKYTISDNECSSDECDKNLPYVNACGKVSGCASDSNIYEDKDGSCKEYYCEKGTLNPDTKKCDFKGCPPTTTMINGVCTPD